MPSEEIHKVIRLGHSLVVVLPKPWTTYFKLTDKDKVRVICNGSVQISIMKPQPNEESAPHD
ncbi:MAG: hypothetical protein WCD81_08610 [Candidatus Bathyarchaeia archaeon]